MANEAVVGESEGGDVDGAAPKAGNGGKARSGTAYPYFGLQTAIEIVEAVRRAGGNESACVDVMREMNVKKQDRPWAYGVPAAMQFGLIERIGRGDEGRLKLTDLALRIVMPASDDEARVARVAAFKKPELYSKLLERFAGHPQPPKDGLKNVLYRDFQILESMAPNAAEAFLDSLKAAGLVGANNVITTGATDPGGSATQADKPPPPPPPGTQQLTVPANFIIYRCKIGKNRFLDIPLPPEFSKAEAKKLHAFLLTQVDDADGDAEDAKEPGGQRA